MDCEGLARYWAKPLVQFDFFVAIRELLAVHGPLLESALLHFQNCLSSAVVDDLGELDPQIEET